MAGKLGKQVKKYLDAIIYNVVKSVLIPLVKWEI